MSEVLQNSLSHDKFNIDHHLMHLSSISKYSLAICSDRKRVESRCWFCLSSPDVESHLIFSIGEGYYCALAKGPLVPNHVLVVQIEDLLSTLMMPVEAEAELRRDKNE